jgi:hypothetical protein
MSDDLSKLPIRRLIDALAAEDDLPIAAIEACVERIDEAAPPLRALLAKAARSAPLTDDEAAQVFFGLHALAKARDQESCAALLTFLRQPLRSVEEVLGDAITASLPRLLAGVYDNDEAALFATIADRALDQDIREALLRAATFLTFEGRIARETMQAFLERFDDEALAGGEDVCWIGWLEAIALLGFRVLETRTESIWTDGRLPEMAVDRSEFEADLAAAERAPKDAGRLERADLGYLDDVEEALSWTQEELPPLEPVVNPMRDVGRNDPCPCGSGKKAKKCCLG